MDSWLRIAIFALILLSFLRRILKVKAQRRPPSPASQSTLPPTMTPTISRPRSGKKNDFRDVPPPPENPELG
jgi:hypothetical protein